jgi:hypothetical protein
MTVPPYPFGVQLYPHRGMESQDMNVRYGHILGRVDGQDQVC